MSAPELPLGLGACGSLEGVKPLVIHDPRGVGWYLTFSKEIVGVEHLERAIAGSLMTDREKQRRRRAFGVTVGRFGKGAWGRAHAYAFVMHAETPGERRAWISAARSRKEVRADLRQLASKIERGDEPAPSNR